MEIKVRAECSAGHIQEFTFIGMDRDFVEGLCGLMDGSSPMYKYPPGPESMIGKCQWQKMVTPEELANPFHDHQTPAPICGRQIKCTIVEGD
jgi:hypothetical protein